MLVSSLVVWLVRVTLPTLAALPILVKRKNVNSRDALGMRRDSCVLLAIYPNIMISSELFVFD